MTSSKQVFNPPRKTERQAWICLGTSNRYRWRERRALKKNSERVLPAKSVLQLQLLVCTGVENKGSMSVNPSLGWNFHTLWAFFRVTIIDACLCKCEYTQTWHYTSRWLCHVAHPIHEKLSVPRTLFAIVMGSFCQLFCAFFTLVIHWLCSLLGIQKVLLLPHNSGHRLPLRNNYFPTYKSQKRLNHLLLLFLNMRALE